MISLDDIFAQEAAVSSIRRAYEADRLPHGLIFAGPVGVGKATTARALAAVFLCEQPRDIHPCGVCGSCQVFDAGNHPDYHVITKELIRYHDKTGKSKGIDLSINVIRPELIEPANRKASLGRGKVFIIEQAEVMTAQAQNAMLKTLEEPAGRTLIVLLTDQSGALLPTIRSRCQVVRFASLDRKRVEGELKKRKIAPEQAADAARFAEGSLGLALRWLEDGVVDGGRELAGQIDGLFSGRAMSDLPDWFKKAADAYAEKQLVRDELASKDQATREGLAVYLRIASQEIRRRLSEEDDADLLDRVCSAIEAIGQSEFYLDANVNVALVFQQLSLKLEKEFAGR